MAMDCCDLDGHRPVRRNPECFCYARGGYASPLGSPVHNTLPRLVAVDGGDSVGAAAWTKVSHHPMEAPVGLGSASRDMCSHRCGVQRLGGGLGAGAQSM